MTRRLADPTASQAIARTNHDRPRHRAGCSVNGGFRRHGVKGWRCPACAPEDREERLLVRLDRFVGGGFHG